MADTAARDHAVETIDRVIIRFAGDSGDGMQLTGDRFTSASALWGNDLSTLPEARGKGYGGMLLDYVAELARAAGYDVITLDSGHQRHTAHRLYLNKGFSISSHHFTKKLK